MCLIKELSADYLKIKVYSTRKSLGENAAAEAAFKIRELLREKPEINIIFAAAPSQNEFLEALLKEDIEWDKINAFHMDEYIGLDAQAPQGFGNFLRDRIFGKVPFKAVHYIRGNTGDAQQECARYAELLKKHPTDIVCLGIGENGHLAFNDPPVADFQDRFLVKTVELDAVCRQQQVNDGCFASFDLVPTHAITVTIPGLIAGRYIYGMVPGRTKTEAVYHTAKDRIGTSCPATILKTHKNAVLFTDMDSAYHLL